MASQTQYKCDAQYEHNKVACSNIYGPVMWRILACNTSVVQPWQQWPVVNTHCVLWRHQREYVRGRVV